MTKWGVAAVLSAGLHGFLLTQWPSPYAQVPTWRSTGTMEVTFIPSEQKESGLAGRLSSVKSEIISPMRGGGSQAFGGPNGHGVPPKFGGTSEGRRIAKPRSLGETSVPESRPLESAKVASPGPTSGLRVPSPASTPSLLTPADFARYRYKQTLRNRLARSIDYPAGGVQPGRIALRLTIGRDGRIREVACGEGGSTILEEATLQGIAAVQPLPGFPQELSSDSETYDFLVAFEPGGSTSVSP